MRLQRRGRKNDPSFRVILVESKRAAKTGSFNEVLGSYDPHTKRVDIKSDRIKYWLSMGATVSDTLHNMLVSQHIIEGKKVNVLPRKSPPKKEEEAVAAALAAEAASAAEEVKEAAAEAAPAEDAASATEEKSEAAGDNEVAA